MAAKYRIGVIGFAHMHVNGLIDAFDQLPEREWVACADTMPRTPSLSEEPGTRRANIRRALEYTKIPRFYDSYQKMLSQEKMDIVIVCAENSQHAEVVEAVAESGANIVVEKPMAPNLSDALRMVRAAERNGVTLAVNWPSTWMPLVRQAYSLVSQGEIGKVFKFLYRNSASLGPLAYGQKISPEEKSAEWWHQADAGGGAFYDYCCYGACLARWFIGESASGVYSYRANFLSPYGDADDNGLIAARFPQALAILEGSWTTLHPGIANGPIVYGSQGTLVCDSVKEHAVLVYQEKGAEPTMVVHPESLPEGRENIAREFTHHLETGDKLHPTLDIPVNLDAMAILDAGIRSAERGEYAPVLNRTWQIG